MSTSIQTNIYKTVWNGGTPFNVELLDTNTVKVIDYENNTEEIKYEQIFIGESPLNEMTKFSGGHGDQFKGNSILLKINENKYMFIGGEKYSFNALSDIVRFVSPVGNNLVPYPFAEDKNGDIYLMVEKVMMLSVKGKINIDDPYTYYYSHSLITSDMSFIPPKLPKIDFGIKICYIDDELVTLTYTPEPSGNYDRITNNGKSRMFIVDSDNDIFLFSKTDYICLIRKVGGANGFHPFIY